MGRMMLNVYRERRTVRPPDDPNLRELRGLPAVPVGSCHLSWRVLSHSVARPVKYSVNPQGTLFTPATKYTVTGWPSWRPNKLRKSWACRHKEACAAAANFEALAAIAAGLGYVQQTILANAIAIGGGNISQPASPSQSRTGQSCRTTSLFSECPVIPAPPLPGRYRALRALCVPN